MTLYIFKRVTIPVCNTTVVCNEPSEFLEFDLHLDDLRFSFKSFNLIVLFTSKMKFIMVSSTTVSTCKHFTTAFSLVKVKKLDKNVSRCNLHVRN